MRQPEELRIQTNVDDLAWVSQGLTLRPIPFGHALLLWAAMSASLSVEARQVWPVYRLDSHHGHRPPTRRTKPQNSWFLRKTIAQNRTRGRRTNSGVLG